MTGISQLSCVSPGGTANVAYADGCRQLVRPGEVITITPSSPCTNPFAHDPTVAQGVSGPPDQSYSNALLGASAGLAAGALGVAIYALTKNNNTNTTVGITCGSAGNPCYTKVSP